MNLLIKFLCNPVQMMSSLIAILSAPNYKTSEPASHSLWAMSFVEPSLPLLSAYDDACVAWSRCDDAWRMLNNTPPF